MQPSDAKELEDMDASSYDDVAETFDQMSERYSKPAVERLLVLANIGPRDRVLDLGSGNGVVALRAAAIATGGQVTRVRSDWAGATLSLTPETFWDVSAVYGSAERVRLAELAPADAARLKAAFLDQAHDTVGRGGRLLYRCGGGRLLNRCGARIYVASR